MAELKKNKIKILEDIKSTYIIKEVFSFLYEKQKLNIIIYNKHLQNRLGVDIEYYKKIGRQYKIGDKNGIGKVYDLNTNKLRFEGEYINGKRHGKGKEYNYNGKLEFEGEYINGKRHGKGKEYYINGKLIFEGDYKNGNKWNGKGYNINGDLKYEIKNGNGNIIEYYYDGKLLFEGEYINGERDGKGKNIIIMRY